MKYIKNKLTIWAIIFIGVILIIYWGLNTRYIHYLYTKTVWIFLVQDEFAKCNDGLLPDASFIFQDKGNFINLRLGGEYKDLNPISRLNMVDTITLGELRVKDLEFTKGMTNLKGMYVNNRFLNSLSGVENHKKLFDLYIMNASKISNLKPLANLTINTLILDDLSLNNIEVLASMKIKQLSLAGGKQIEDISPIGKIKSLESLDISGTGVKDLSSIAKCKTLTYLNLSETAVSDLSPLESTNIKKLEINETQVDSLAPLYKMRKLKIIIIDKNIPALLNMTDAERKEFEKKFHKSSRMHPGGNADFYLKRPLSPREKKNEWGY